MSMLRSSKFLRYFISVARNIVINRQNDVDNTLLKSSKHLTNFSLSYANQPLTSKNSIDKYIQRLDQDVRRSGRISKRELEEAFNEIKHSKHATSTQSLMVIRCCGNLVPDESPELRTKLVNEIWSTFEKIGVPFDISHYNALLRVYLENEHQFSPSQFLADLEAKGVEPNRVTYQRLIASYCQRGDIEGATRILQYMKEKQIPVNESVFNSLIMGHFQADDVESAVGILGVMKQANIKPSGDTYTTLMCGHAKSGNMTAIREILSQCENEDIELSDRDILEVMYTLGVNKHIDLIDELSNDLKKLPGYNQDAKNAVLRLIVKGEDKAALKIFRTMIPVVPSEGETMPIGNFILRQMVKSGRPIETILGFCEELKGSGENDSGLLVATEASLFHGNPEMSLKLLTALSKEHEVCHHYYWPVLVQYGKKGNITGITDTLLQMVEEIGQPISGETLRDYVVPFIPQNEEGIYRLKEGGIPMPTAAAALVGHFLMKNDIKSAANIGLKFRANYKSMQLCKSAVMSFINSKDLQSFITMVRIIAESGKDDDKDIVGKILLDLVQNLKKNRPETITSVLKEYLAAGLAISNGVAEELQSMLHGGELTSEIETLLSKITSSDLTPTELHRPAQSGPQKKILDEGYILKAIKAANEKGEPAWNLKRQLLSLYCANKDLENAEKLKKEMDEGGFEFLVGGNVMMMDLYTHHEKLEEALAYYNKIFENGDVEVDPGKLLKLGALMVKNDMIQEAIDMFTKRKLNPDSQLNQGYNFNPFAWRILNILAEKKDVENLQKIFDCLLENNFLIPNNVVLGPLIKVHILRDDINSALAVFEECCTKYRATPWKNELSCKFIEKEDPVSLQKLTDLSTQIHGEINSLYDLVLSFVECGRIRQARKILETPGLRTRSQRINSACERYDAEGHINHLENLVEATKDLNHLDRAEIYYHLLSTYCKTNEVDKAMGLWTQMQDEDVQPSDQFLVKLGNLLKENNRLVPFSIPSSEIKTVPKQPLATAKSLPIRTFRSAINSKDVEAALGAMERLREDELNNGDRSKLIMLLATNGRIGEASKILIGWLEKNMKTNVRTLSLVISLLAKEGDVDSLNVIGSYLDENVKKMTSFNNRHTHCMVLAGRSEEVLNLLESKIKSASSPADIAQIKEQFPRGGIFSVFENSPELINRFEEIATLFREKGILEPTNILWSYYTISGNSEKAKEAWSLLQPSDRLLFQPVLKHARNTGDLKMTTDLLELCKTSGLPVKPLGLIYSAAVDIAFSLGRIEEAEQLLDRGVHDCTIENINRGTLLKIKKYFEINGKEFKYSIPTKMNAPQSSSSSSSDSDSDSERPVKKATN